jgi:hypothetical protein
MQNVDVRIWVVHIDGEAPGASVFVVGPAQIE